MSLEPATPGEPIFFLAPVVISLIALCTGLYGLQTYVFGEAINRNVIILAAFIPARYSQGLPLDLACFVSPVGYSFLHAGLAHLAINMVWLAAFGSPLAARIGAVRFLLFWAATSVGAALLHFSIYPESQAPMIGASGAISGMMGAAARFSFRISHGRGMRAFMGEPLSITAALASRTVLTFVAIWFAANFIAGLGWPGNMVSPSNIAWEAHIGGFLTGFILIGGFDRPNLFAR
jgi:membrane associated rhomboid family serine protease